MSLGTKCSNCNAFLFLSNKFCPFCGEKNKSAISKSSDVGQQIIFDGLPGTEELAIEAPCTEEKHQNIVKNLKLNKIVGGVAPNLIEIMNYCPDCGQKLDKE